MSKSPKVLEKGIVEGEPSSPRLEDIRSPIPQEKFKMSKTQQALVTTGLCVMAASVIASLLGYGYAEWSLQAASTSAAYLGAQGGGILLGGSIVAAANISANKQAAALDHAKGVTEHDGKLRILGNPVNIHKKAGNAIIGFVTTAALTCLAWADLEIKAINTVGKDGEHTDIKAAEKIRWKTRFAAFGTLAFLAAATVVAAKLGKGTNKEEGVPKYTPVPTEDSLKDLAPPTTAGSLDKGTDTKWRELATATRSSSELER